MSRTYATTMFTEVSQHVPFSRSGPQFQRSPSRSPQGQAIKLLLRAFSELCVCNIAHGRSSPHARPSRSRTPLTSLITESPPSPHHLHESPPHKAQSRFVPRLPFCARGSADQLNARTHEHTCWRTPGTASWQHPFRHGRPRCGYRWVGQSGRGLMHTHVGPLGSGPRALIARSTDQSDRPPRKKKKKRRGGA